MGRMALVMAGALALSAVSAVPAKADIIHHLINPATIKQFCKSNNGTYWPDSVGHTYGCLYDGGVIVCGGVGMTGKDKNSDTCYESMVAPHRWPAPPHPSSIHELK